MISRISGFYRKPKYEPFRSGDIVESVANIDQAKSALGFEPEYSFEEGLEITFEWYKSAQRR
jgi:nucleoside-diphosphate-sugar epimerase